MDVNMTENIKNMENSDAKVEPVKIESTIIDENTNEVKTNGQDVTMIEPKDKTIETKEPSKEFAYLERDEFTSEIYKIEVRNLGYFGIGEFKKLIKNKLKLDMTKIKSPLRKDFAFVCFRNREEQQRAIKSINGLKWKGKTLTASEAKASADPLQKKRRQENENPTETPTPKRQRTSAEATCPLHNIPYEEQLAQKSKNICEILKSFVNGLKHTNSKFRQFENEFQFDKESADGGGLVKPSPLINGYRNKSEFTVGRNKDNEIVVGFRLGCYADGSVEVAEVQDLPHLPEAAKWVARSFQTFMRNSQAHYLPFNPESNTGHVRQIMARTSQYSNEIMIMPGINTDNMKPEEVQQFKEDLKSYYGDLAASSSAGDDDATPAVGVDEVPKKFKCTSLYVQDVKRRRPGQVVCPVEHLAGTEHITEMLLGLKFAISPLAFFQINTPAAEVLYQTAIDLARPHSDSFMLDICCGTGTIGLAFAKHCRQVFGVDIVADAILDAKRNAKENGIENCKFYAGNADDTIKNMVHEIIYANKAEKDNLDIIAVVDPPRSGLHNRSIQAIRGTAAIKRLVYISCSPESAKRNWLDLGRAESKQYTGEPFFPKKAIAVDLFPHTMHTELVILFERGGGGGSAGGSDAGNTEIKDETKMESEPAQIEKQVDVAESVGTANEDVEIVDKPSTEQT